MIPKRSSDDVFETHDRVKISPDLLAILGWAFATVICIYLPLLSGTPLLFIFGLPTVIFIPGYVLVSALFPENDEVSGIERFALSFGLSIVVVPLIGLALNFTPWGIRLTPIITSLVFFTAAMAIIAQYRRSRLPPEKQYIVPFLPILLKVKGKFFEPEESRFNRAVSVILILAVVAAGITVVYGFASPTEEEHFTEFYILGESGNATGYPERFAAGDPQTVIIGISNHEYHTVTYTVETILLNMTIDSTINASTIHAAKSLNSFTTTLAHNETWEFPYTFSITDTKYNRLQFLLYNGTIPPESVNTSYRINASHQDLHLWVTVQNPQEIEK
jgi:uncharacterized membrane protein